MGFWRLRCWLSSSFLFFSQLNSSSLPYKGPLILPQPSRSVSFPALSPSPNFCQRVSNLRRQVCTDQGPVLRPNLGINHIPFLVCSTWFFPWLFPIHELCPQWRFPVLEIGFFPDTSLLLVVPFGPHWDFFFPHALRPCFRLTFSSGCRFCGPPNLTCSPVKAFDV